MSQASLTMHSPNDLDAGQDAFVEQLVQGSIVVSGNPLLDTPTQRARLSDFFRQLIKNCMGQSFTIVLENAGEGNFQGDVYDPAGRRINTDDAMFVIADQFRASVGGCLLHGRWRNLPGD